MDLMLRILKFVSGLSFRPDCLSIVSVNKITKFLHRDGVGNGSIP